MQEKMVRKEGGREGGRLPLRILASPRTFPARETRAIKGRWMSTCYRKEIGLRGLYGRKEGQRRDEKEERCALR